MTEPLGAGNSREYDILGIKMFDSAELRVHMTGKAILRTGAKTQGQGHETTWAQIVAHELGIPAEDVDVEEGDTDTAPFGMGTYASRSTPVAGAAVAMVSRKIRAKARKLGRPPARGLRGGRRVGARAGSTCAARPTAASPSRSARWRPTATCPTAWSPASRTTPTTTRPT
jgi:CO/xanthine dehydrogenase Mo-binding subunit